ncbi:MAG: PIN domain-containing protein [Sulfurimonas sp.]|nr:PIN domain-containing protein [Sulfurimonas sp.]
MHKVFFDANIINDIYDTKRVNSKNSFFALKKCLENNIEVTTSCDIVTNIYYITAKYTDKVNALKALEDVESIFTVLPFDNKVLKKAIELMKADDDYNDLEDTLQYVLAQESGCDIIISNDKKFVSKEIKLLNAQNFTF